MAQNIIQIKGIWLLWATIFLFILRCCGVPIPWLIVFFPILFTPVLLLCIFGMVVVFVICSWIYEGILYSMGRHKSPERPNVKDLKI